MRSFYKDNLQRHETLNKVYENFEGLTKEQIIETSVACILTALGVDLAGDSYAETPYRVAKMYTKELFSSIGKKPEIDITTFSNKSYKHYVSMKGIPYYSTCSHHLMPFFGKVDIAYFPSQENSRIIGLSKLPRIIKFLSRKPQVQEEFTNEIAEFIFKELKPTGILVRVTGLHTCVSARGAEVESEVTTEAMLGTIDKNEVLHLWQ